MVPEIDSAPEIHKTGSRLADKAVAFSALFVSLCSLAIALHHGRTMQRLVEANSRPFIQITSKSGQQVSAGDSERALVVTVSNPGAGAARIERFTMLVDDKGIDSFPHALLQLAGVSAAPGAAAETSVLGPMTYADIAPSYLKPGSEEVVLRWPRTAGNAAVWDRVIAAGPQRVKYETCYCSIFEECWIENSHTFRPKPAKSCS